MNRLSCIADKVARNLTSGVEISIRGYNPTDLGWVMHQLYQGLRDFGRKIDIQPDGTTSTEDFTGTINIYVKDPEDVNNVRVSAWDVIGHFGLVGIDAKVRQDVSKMRNMPVVRVDVMKNSEQGGLEGTNITYSTWREILDHLGLTDEDEQAGSMPINIYLSAAITHPKEEYENDMNRLNRYIGQISDMAKKAKARGYKDIVWG